MLKNTTSRYLITQGYFNLTVVLDPIQAMQVQIPAGAVITAAQFTERFYSMQQQLAAVQQQLTEAYECPTSQAPSGTSSIWERYHSNLEFVAALQQQLKSKTKELSDFREIVFNSNNKVKIFTFSDSATTQYSQKNLGAPIKSQTNQFSHFFSR